MRRIFLSLAVIGVMVLFSCAGVQAQSHPASQILPGTFGGTSVDSWRFLGGLRVNGITLDDDADITGADQIMGFNDLRLYGDSTGGPDIYITTGGNVGIGTAVPGTARFNVSGNVYVQGNIQATGEVCDGGGLCISTTGTGTVTQIDTGVGIGGGPITTTGTISFDCSDVTGTADDHIGCSGENLVVSDDWVDIDGDTMTGDLRVGSNSLYFQDGDNSHGVRLYHSSSDGYLNFVQSGSGTGNVYVQNSIDNFYMYPVNFRIGFNDYTHVDFGDSNTYINDVDFYLDDGSNYREIGVWSQSAEVGQLYTNADDDFLINNPTADIILQPGGGNVGVGSLYGSGKLRVVQDGTGDIFNLYDGITNVFTVRDGGNVGIGKAPASGVELDVQGDIKASGTVCDGYGNCLDNVGGGGTSYWSLYDGTSNIYRLNGNVGIGIDQPTQKLDVRGNVLVTGGIRAGSQGSPGPWGIHVTGPGYISDYLRTGSYAIIGTTSRSSDLMLDVGGKVGATEYCDENGENCFTVNVIKRRARCPKFMGFNFDVWGHYTEGGIFSGQPLYGGFINQYGLRVDEAGNGDEFLIWESCTENSDGSITFNVPQVVQGRELVFSSSPMPGWDGYFRPNYEGHTEAERLMRHEQTDGDTRAAWCSEFGLNHVSSHSASFSYAYDIDCGWYDSDGDATNGEWYRATCGTSMNFIDWITCGSG